MVDTLVREFAVAIYAAIFALLAIRALLDWRTRRDRSSLWFSVAFGVLAVVVIGSVPIELAYGDAPPVWLTRVIVLLIALHPPALLRFASAFGSIGRIEQWAISVGFVLLAAWSLTLTIPQEGERGSDAFIAFSIAFVVAWSIVTVRVTSSLWFSSRERPGIVRGRMRLLALGVLTLNLALLVPVADPGGDHALASAVITSASALLLLAGFAPFSWLRIILRQHDQQQVRNAINGLVAATREEQLFEALLPATRDLIGVTSIAIFHDDMFEPLTLGYDATDVADIRELLETLDPQEERTQMAAGRLVRRDVDSWTVVNAPSGGEFFGEGELDVLTSINTIARMIRTRLRDAARIVEHEQRLQTAVDIAQLGKWEWQVGSQLVTWSDGMHRIFGSEPGSEITYERYQAMIAPEERERLSATISAAIEHGESYEVDHRVVRPDGTEVFVHSRAMMSMGDDGNVNRIVGVTMDITARVRAEQELRRAVEIEREVAERLRNVDELKTSILSAVSHELRTPLTSVHGLGVVLQDRMEQLDAEKRREIVDHIVAESERLGRLLADLLDIDRLRRGTILPQRSAVDVARLVRGVIELRDRPEQFVLDVDDVIFPLDGPKFERIVENLVANAEKYAGHDARVVIRASTVGDELQLRVEDDGPGVPDGQREAIFEPFNRGAAELGYAPGTGIGLSLVMQFAQLHGGSARVEPRDGGGAAFIVTLPADGQFDESIAVVG